MYEEVLGLVVGGDEPEALVVTEPLHDACSHCYLRRVECCERGDAVGKATSAGTSSSGLGPDLIFAGYQGLADQCHVPRVAAEHSGRIQDDVVAEVGRP